MVTLSLIEVVKEGLQGSGWKENKGQDVISRVVKRLLSLRRSLESWFVVVRR